MGAQVVNEDRGFRALVDFWCDELNCQYSEGLSYTVRVSNDALRERVARWVADDKAEWMDEAETKASVAGSGTVQ